MNVTLYTRQGCHLCETAEAVLRRVLADRPEVALDVVDIDADPDLVQRYTVRVPVVTVDGTEVAEYEVDEAALRRALAPRTKTKPVDAAPAQPEQPSRRASRRGLRWLGVLVIGAALLAALTIASVALITPDVFADACARPQLVRPAACGEAEAVAT